MSKALNRVAQGSAVLVLLALLLLLPAVLEAACPEGYEEHEDCSEREAHIQACENEFEDELVSIGIELAACLGACSLADDEDESDCRVVCALADAEIPAIAQLHYLAVGLGQRLDHLPEQFQALRFLRLPLWGRAGIFQPVGSRIQRHLRPARAGAALGAVRDNRAHPGAGRGPSAVRMYRLQDLSPALLQGVQGQIVGTGNPPRQRVEPLGAASGPFLVALEQQTVPRCLLEPTGSQDAQPVGQSGSVAPRAKNCVCGSARVHPCRPGFSPSTAAGPAGP